MEESSSDINCGFNILRLKIIPAVYVAVGRDDRFDPRDSMIVPTSP